MEVDTDANGGLAFGPFELDLRSRELRRAGRPVHLPPKPAEVLTLLATQADRVVTREEIREAVWPDTVIDFDNALNTCIRQIRAALGDRGDASVFIETLPRRGYRLRAPVTWTGGPATAVDPAAFAATARGGWRTWRRWLLAIAVGAGAILAALALRHAVVVAGDRTQVLLVLPVQDMSEDAAPYFGEGLTEDLIASLGGIEPDRLRVIALASAMRFQPSAEDAGELAATLGVDLVLTASVRRSGERLRIVAQLVRRADGVNLWAESFDRAVANPLDVQRDIAASVARSLSLALAPEADDVGPRGEPLAAARLAFLEGRHLLRAGDRVSWLAAAGRLEEVVARDPDFASGHAYLAEAYMLTGATAAARAEVERALTLDARSAHAHYVHGHLLMIDDWDWPGADAALRRAIELAPGQPEYRQGLAYLLTARGNHRAAMEQIDRAAALDPLSPFVFGDVGFIYYWARRYGEAAEHCRESLTLDPAALWAEECVLNAEAQRGDHTAAVRSAARLLRAYGVAEGEVFTDPGATAAQRLTAYRAWVAGKLEERAAQADAYSLALLYADLGRDAEALEQLARAAETRSLAFVSFAVEPRFDRLRDAPQFQALATAVGVGED